MVALAILNTVVLEAPLRFALLSGSQAGVKRASW